ncbi:outer envelope pore protein 37, chloroplastic-like isoform X1 [Zingiber officinale]|uniref:outer envelope pore protein 37, chloroplastic-like isoform X1 n=1 Tax=Zingiber officinale TaxID=94328 RepID=UPI001C4B11E9|nr:outer envelope pore protein 37, chloroplastic-like isoform X1 [Zingiber officinale]
MADSLPPNAGPNFPSFLLPPRPPTLPASPPPPPPPPLPSQPPPPSSAPGHESLPIAGGHSFSLRRPAVRVTSEFDSDRSVFFHKISCKLFDSLAKLKLTFQNDRNGVIAYPQIGFITKHFAALYDLESRNALLKGFFDIGDALRVRATHDTKTGLIGVPNYFHIGLSAKCLSVSCTYENNNSLLSCFNFGSVFIFKCTQRKEQQGEIAIITNLFNPSYKLEVASPVPSVGLPRATVCFPLGEVSVEEKKDQEAEKVLSISGVLKGYLMNGVCTALYQNEELNLSYRYKDENMSFIPSISLPSQALSFALKRRFNPSDKMSYWYHFDSNDWSIVYKHTVGKDLKFKTGYDSEVRLGWASFWVGDEDGNAKAAPMKMKVQFMVQVPQDDISNSVLLFRVKKRWDF